VNATEDCSPACNEAGLLTTITEQHDLEKNTRNAGTRNLGSAQLSPPQLGVIFHVSNLRLTPSMFDLTTAEMSAGTTIVFTVLDILKRLTAALQLLRLSEDVIPTLVSNGSTTAEHANAVLSQIPALRKDIDEQVNAAKIAMESIQDRVEAVAQFLMLHRKSLTRAQSEDLDRWLAEVRG